MSFLSFEYRFQCVATIAGCVFISSFLNMQVNKHAQWLLRECSSNGGSQSKATHLSEALLDTNHTELGYRQPDLVPDSAVDAPRLSQSASHGSDWQCALTWSLRSARPTTSTLTEQSYEPGQCSHYSALKLSWGLLID